MKKILASAATLLLAFGSIALSANIATADDAPVVEVVTDTTVVDDTTPVPVEEEPAATQEEPLATEEQAAVTEEQPAAEQVAEAVETEVAAEPEVTTGTDPPVEPASFAAAQPVETLDAVFVGVVGDLLPWSPATNDPKYWEDYTDHQMQCFKHGTDPSSNDHGSITDGGKTVTLNTFNQNWWGDHWELLVVKGGSVSNNVIVHPTAGVAYASPVNAGGQQSDVSHWIVCKGTTPEVETPVASASVQTTPGTCEAPGSVSGTNAVNATFGDPVYTNGTYTIVATATGDAKFEPGDDVSNGGTTKTFTGQVPPQNTELCEGTVTYCHATPADTAANGWQLMSNMPVQSVNGHKEHAADIIPPVPGILPAGLNWNESFVVNGVELTAQEILRLGCEFEITVPADPTSTDEYCVEDEAQDGSITVYFGDLGAKIEYRITGGDGVDKTIESGDATTVYLPAGVYTVTAEAVAPYELTGQDEWEFTIKSAVDCGDLPTFDLVVPTVSFTQPTCAANGTFTVGGADVQWARNGQPISNGTYSLASGVQIELTAAPKPPHGFDPDQQTSWTVSFEAASGACGDLTTLALTGGGSDQTAPITVAGFLVLLGLAAVYRARRTRAVR